ncbi:MAG: hypothetical protein DRR00_01525 [Candidatus Parabeggiatoa sp. nov. 3]|nr:MAG: hypothetical protein DRR00_01525 [Gammaproteobacteria bacterium]RKZ68087.1 MAG: hypothetical protein DRQ99_04895 [Gammaproteobacteria bacterium]
MNIAFKNSHLMMLAASVLVVSSCATKAPQKSEPELEPEQAVPVKPVEKPKPKYIQVAERDADRIGKKIWMNEGSGKIKNLTIWNQGENFASLGIGHFIWYPAGKEGSFKETFPELIVFLQEQGVEIPTWLQKTPPWKSYTAFKRDEQSADMKQLRTLLVNTIPEQVQFIIRRLELALPKMLESLPTEAQRTQVREQFYRVAQQSAGVYALIDYVNFKGEGTSPRERYQGQGWGLLQVLENMRDSDNVMAEFAESAEFVLKRRIKNAPPARNESRWLPGWKNRIKTYTAPL